MNRLGELEHRVTSPKRQLRRNYLIIINPSIPALQMGCPKGLKTKNISQANSHDKIVITLCWIKQGRSLCGAEVRVSAEEAGWLGHAGDGWCISPSIQENMYLSHKEAELFNAPKLQETDRHIWQSKHLHWDTPQLTRKGKRGSGRFP